MTIKARQGEGPVKRAIRNAGWLLAGKGVGGIFSLVYLALAARSLGAEQFGVFALILSSPVRPIQVTIDRKASYDSDDMKVTLDGTRLIAIGKSLAQADSHAESIGLLRFMGEGPGMFRAKIEQMLRTQDGISAWFLKAIDAIARTTGEVETLSIQGRAWAEVDTVADFEALGSLPFPARPYL